MNRTLSTFFAVLAPTTLSALPAAAHPGGMLHDIVDGLVHPATVAVAAVVVVTLATRYLRRRKNR